MYLERQPNYEQLPLVPYVDSLESRQPTVSDVAVLIANVAAKASVSIENGAEADRSNEIFRLKRNPETYEIEVGSDLTLKDYQKITPEADWKLFLNYTESLKEKTVVFINPTMEGGGVAMLRPPLVHLLRLRGINAHWYVMEGQKTPDDPDPFLFTKLMHNVSQRRMPENIRINEKGKAVHWAWNTQNAEVLKEQDPIRNADIVFIDDPQPAPLKKLLADVTPNAKWVWRNHIDTSRDLMSDPSSPQGEVASYIMDECGIRDVDAVVAHPVPEFIHPGMEEKTYFAPAVNEPHDDLNKVLDPEEIREGIEFLNKEIAAKNEKLIALGRQNEVQSFIDPSRKRIIIIARFDPSKGMKKAMLLGVKTREIMREYGVSGKDLPQVILVGNGSVDDPDGKPMLEEKLRIKREEFSTEKDDIIIIRARHNYQAINALMYPSEKTDGSDQTQVVGLQTSDAEGCETRISDWIRHGVPVLISNRGGMPLQVKEGKSGYIMNYDKPDLDLNRGASIIAEMLMDPAKYAEMRRKTAKTAKEFNDREFTTTANVTRLARVFKHVLDGEVTGDKTWEVSKIVR